MRKYIQSKFNQLHKTNIRPSKISIKMLNGRGLK